MQCEDCWELEHDDVTLYRFREFSIRPDMMGAIHRYIHHGLNPGHFLSAVIDNDLAEAVGRADDQNLRNLPAFVGYFYNEAPAACWGSKEKRIEWVRSVRERIHPQDHTPHEG